MGDRFACAASRSLIMDAEGPRDGARCADGRFAELCCADVARCTRQRWAGAAEGSPCLVHHLDALNFLCSRPLRGSLPVLCWRRRHRAILDSWSRGYQAAVLELELPEAALSPPGRCTAEPLPEGWSSLYPYPFLRDPVRTSLSTRRDSARHRV